jgi:hypothetical protein
VAADASQVPDGEGSAELRAALQHKSGSGKYCIDSFSAFVRPVGAQKNVKEKTYDFLHAFPE